MQCNQSQNGIYKQGTQRFFRVSNFWQNLVRPSRTCPMWPLILPRQIMSVGPLQRWNVRSRVILWGTSSIYSNSKKNCNSLNESLRKLLAKETFDQKDFHEIWNVNLLIKDFVGKNYMAFPPCLIFLVSVFRTFLTHFSDPTGYLEEFTSPCLIKKKWIFASSGSRSRAYWARDRYAYLLTNDACWYLTEIKYFTYQHQMQQINFRS